MKLATKQRIDHLIGIPVLAGINTLARLLGLLLRRNHDLLPVKTILIMKFQGMGSLVIAKPALAQLRQRHRDARIIFWGTQGTCVLAHEMPEFDHVLTLQDKGLLQTVISLAQNLIFLWRQGIHWAFDLEVYSKLSSVLTTLTCARNRAGFAVDSVRFRKNTHTHLVFFNRYEYLGYAYGRLLGLLMMAPQSNIDYTQPATWKHPLQDLKKIPTPYFVVNMHAGELALERRWPQQYFDTLIQKVLTTKPSHHIVLIGHGSFEEKESQKIKPHPRLLNLTNALSLHETLCMLAHADCVVSNDSAPLHLALTTSAPVVALFGPTRASSYLPPKRSHTIALSTRLYCSPCVHHWTAPPCNGDNQCLKRISVQQVLEAILNQNILPDAQDLPPLQNADYYPGLVYQRP